MSEIISAKVSDRTAERLDNLAERFGVSRSAVIRAYLNSPTAMDWKTMDSIREYAQKDAVELAKENSDSADSDDEYPRFHG